MCERMLRRIVDGELSWEDALASMRVFCARDPDVYDNAFMVTLRYGDKPRIVAAFGEQVAMNSKNPEMIDVVGSPGLRIQRYCPHQGADLMGVAAINGTIQCPRHFWQFSCETGECISGGNMPIRVEHLDW